MKPREIKLRAWDRDAGRMVYGGTDSEVYTSIDGMNDGYADDALQDVTRTFVTHPWPNHSGEVIEMAYEHDFMMSNDRVFKGTIMEYTGLKDKNDRDIYEADIVRYKGRNLIEVKFGTFKDSGVLLHSGWNISEPSSDYEVVGNAYESPELLEAKS